MTPRKKTAAAAPRKTKLSRAQRAVVIEARDEFVRKLRMVNAGRLPGPEDAIEMLEHAVIAATEVERERIADELAGIIGDYLHGLDDLEGLEARLRRGEP